MSYAFGPHLIRSNQIFLFSKLSFAFVNLKPVLPGHVLVAPFRVVPRFAELTYEEICDLFSCTQTIGKVIEREYHATSLTIAMQDGPEAGQTVPHCHVHLIPRKAGDYANNDDIYKDIEKSSKVDNEERPPRSLEEMAREAEFLRQFFKDSK
ncbi:HIT-like protein [Gigaspora margarita]|uniref:Bis(5'-adenosyl)-triphosphatase n=1 Tax=Gigaspora margarita TaxID=4874 RepID=A0A8H3XFD6_GIGMA|nr:HIT-like protein [Gigaspora margarita]